MSVDQFLEYLRRSQLIDDARLDNALTEIERKASDSQLEDVEYISNELIKRGLITIWHARQLMKKRYKGFFLRHYKILGHLGSGGMSTVYLGEHVLMQRRVAIKVLPKKRLRKSTYLDRFIREAQAIAQLDHPHIVRAYDIDQHEDIHYIVMEYFDGPNLQKIVQKDGPLPYEKAVEYIRQAADALSHAHRIGVIHRDVKPGNLLVNSDGLLKVLDLGLALLDEQKYEGFNTIQEENVLGTADYLAPEQAVDSHKVDSRADIYALGGCLYFFLTGHPPFPTGSVSKRLLAHQQQEPESILIDRPDAPADLVSLCRKMMSKKPDDRQQSADEVNSDMQNWLILHGFARESDFLNASRRSPSEMYDISESGEEIPLPGASDSDFMLGGGKTSTGQIELAPLVREKKPQMPAESDGYDMLLSHFDRQREQAVDDPLLFALNEIELERRQTNPDTGGHALESGVQAVIDSAVNLGTPSSANVQLEGSSGNLTPEAREAAKRLTGDGPPLEMPPDVLGGHEMMPAWYKLVPFWFWSVFAGVIAAAIFLAGILVALITVTGSGNR